jgi:hypothetical protein
MYNNKLLTPVKVVDKQYEIKYNGLYTTYTFHLLLLWLEMKLSYHVSDDI